MRFRTAACRAAGISVLTSLLAVMPAWATTEPAPATANPAAAQPAQTAQPADAKPAGEAPAEQVAAPAPEKPKPLPPTLIARINLPSQTMTVTANGKVIHTWRVSSGAPGYATPPGTFRPGWMAKMWRSRQYDDAPMPYSVFFNGGIAVHGTMNPGSLGRAASHGCVRLATSNAAVFYNLVTRHGMDRTRIIVQGPQPFGRSEMVASRARPRAQRSANEWVYSQQGSHNMQRATVVRYDSYGYTPPAKPRRIASRTVR